MTLRIFCFFVTMTIASGLMAQVELLSTSLLDPTVKIMYAGVDNFVKVDGIKLDDNVYLKSSKGKVRYMEEGKGADFCLRYGKVKRDTLRLFQKENLILEQIFEVKTLPDPIAKLGQISTNSASVKEILSDPEVRIVLENCYWKHAYSFKKFDIILLNSAGHIILDEDDVSGTLIPEHIRAKIREMEKGDMMVIKNIIAYHPDAPGRVISPISITIL